MNKKLEDLMRQASFHQMYVGESVPYVDPVIYKNTNIDTTEAKKKLELSFNKEEIMEKGIRWQDTWSRYMNDLSDRIREIQDMKFHNWVKTTVLSGHYIYSFQDYVVEVIKPNTVRLHSKSLDDFLDLYIERTDIANPTNHWIELQWKLSHHGRLLKEGRDFLNMEVKMNWS